MDSDFRLGAVEARLAILELEGLYARAFDDHDGATWSSLFTPDGIYRSRDVGRELSTGTFVQGTKALRVFCESAPYTGVHLMHLPQISFDGDRATSRIHMEWLGSFQSPASRLQRLVGYYDVAYVRTGSATDWRITDRVTTAFMSESRAVLGYVPGNGLDEPPRSTVGQEGGERQT